MSDYNNDRRDRMMFPTFFKSVAEGSTNVPKYALKKWIPHGKYVITDLWKGNIIPARRSVMSSLSSVIRNPVLFCIVRKSYIETKSSMTNLKSPIRRILSVKINVGSKKEIRLKGANYNAKITHPLQICIPFYITYIYIYLGIALSNWALN